MPSRHKYTKIKYRIEERDGRFYPQKKGMFWGWNYCWESYNYAYDSTADVKVSFATLEEAKDFLTKLQPKESSVSKYHYLGV